MPGLEIQPAPVTRGLWKVVRLAALYGMGPDKFRQIPVVLSLLPLLSVPQKTEEGTEDSSEHAMHGN